MSAREGASPDRKHPITTSRKGRRSQGARFKEEVTQKDLAEAIGVSQRHISEMENGRRSIGIAESYVTAGTCIELSGIPTVCAFSSDNLPDVAKIIRGELRPKSPIILFADNDRHLKERDCPTKDLKWP